MTLHAPYDPENIFARILRGDLPCVKVFEDEVTLAFMDVFPQAEGHTLVVPKHVQSRHLLDLPETVVGAYFERVQKIARAVEAGLKPDGVVVVQYNGAPAGQTVFHLHVHIIPRRDGEAFGRHGGGQMAQPAALELIAARIRAQL